MGNLTDELRYQLLRRLEQNPALTQRELAKELGISLGKANYCIKALIEKGWVEVDNFPHNQNKLGCVYLLTPRGLEEKTIVTLSFLKRKQQECKDLVAELEALHQEVAQLETGKE
jgi:EPS-associated MarR family transcriptional regulator